MSTFYTRGFPDDYVNGRGIPRAEFVEDVGAFLKRKDMSAEGALELMREQYNKYRLMEYKFAQQKQALNGKIPEIRKTLEMVRHLKAKVEADEEMVTWFGLSDTVFVEAVIKDRPKTVGLWLGAQVMMEYTFDEAIALLEKNYATATTNLDQLTEDGAFLRDNMTISEVNIARVYNHQVREKRKEKKAEGGK